MSGRSLGRRWGATAAAGAVLLAGCTSATPAAAPTTHAPTVSASSPTASSDGASGFTPGAATSDDRLFPELGNGGYDVNHYAITISYAPGTHAISGSDVVTATATQGLSRFDLDLRSLTVSSVTVDGHAAAYARSGDKLVVTPAAGIRRGTSFITVVTYAGVPKIYSDPTLGTEGFQTYGTQEAIAQGEPQGAATWFAVNDYPGDKATYDITVTAPSADAALSNGVLVSQKASSGGTTTWHWAESKPMASYLAFVAIGNYRVHTSTHNGLPVVTAVDAALPTSVDAVIARTPEIVDFLATQFGPYPFDAEGGIVQTDPTINFALENQTRPVYSSLFFRGPASADESGVVAHELAHQWYGDSVSLEQWSDIWLNEGFATYAEWLWTQHEGGASPLQTFTDWYQRGKLTTEAPGVRTRSNVFDNAPYDRGAATLEALRISVGDSAFFRIIKAWAAQREYGNGTTDQFIALAEQISGKQLGPLFTAWLDTPGRPAFPQPLS